MKSKLGLFGDNKDDLNLIDTLLDWMNKNRVDYTNTFCYLMGMSVNDKIYTDKNFVDWQLRWKNRSSLNNSNKEKQLESMRKVNPVIIPRNHKVEEALVEAGKGNLDNVKNLLTVLKNPYGKQNKIEEYQTSAPPTNKKYQTYCGT